MSGEVPFHIYDTNDGTVVLVYAWEVLTKLTLSTPRLPRQTTKGTHVLQLFQLCCASSSFGSMRIGCASVLRTCVCKTSISESGSCSRYLWIKERNQTTETARFSSANPDKRHLQVFECFCQKETFHLILGTAIDFLDVWQ